MGVIGFSTGGFYKSGVPLDESIKRILQTRAEAIELCFAKPSELMSFNPSKAQIDELNRLYFISVHAPWKDVRYSSDTGTKQLFEKLGYLSGIFDVSGIVVHPDKVDDFRILQDSGLVFVLENLEKRASFGTMPEHFQSLKRDYDFGFVFDSQHSYQNDATMGSAGKTLSAMGDRLRHMHVSGQNGQGNHSLVHLSDNRKDILDCIRRIDSGYRKKIPMIIEAMIDGGYHLNMEKEIDLINSELF